MAISKKLDYVILDLIESAARTVKVAPLNLGGYGGAAGGVGSPPGGYVGWLPQTNVAYDETEAETLDTAPSGYAAPSGWSLLDNLNHIRYRLGTLESGILVVDEYDGSPSVSNVTWITFSGGAEVSQLAPGHVLVNITASGGTGSGISGIEIQEDGITEGTGITVLNFEGDVDVVVAGDTATVTISGGLGGNENYIDQSGGTSDTYGVLAGSVNGSNTIFTTSAGEYISSSLTVYLNGQLQIQGTAEDWVETNPAAGTFTFSTAPLTGDLITVVYMVAGTPTANADTVDGYHASSFVLDSELFNDAEGNPANIGTAADGTSAYAARRDHVHEASRGQSVLGAGFDITGTTGTFQDTGLSLSLPSAGTYLISGSVRGAIQSTAVDYIIAKFYNSTDAADIADSETLVIYGSVVNTVFQNSVSMVNIVTVAAAKTIKLYAARVFIGTITLTQISSNTAGKTRINYVKIG